MKFKFKEIEIFLWKKKTLSTALDRQSKDLGSNPSAVESIFFSTERFQIL